MKGFRFFTVNNGDVRPGILIQREQFYEGSFLPVLRLGKHELIRLVPIKVGPTEEAELLRNGQMWVEQGDAVLTNSDSNAIVLTATEGKVLLDKVVVLFQGNIIVLTGDDSEGKSNPFPGQIISHTNTELLAVIPKEVWFKASYADATPSGNLAHYFIYVGASLISLTMQNRWDFQILMNYELEKARQQAYSS